MTWRGAQCPALMYRGSQLPSTEVWRYLSKNEIGMGEVEKPIAWILESDEDGPGHNVQRGTTTLLARIEARYLALQQMRMRTDDRGKSSDSGWEEKITGGEVSARSEEHVDGRWRVKHALGPGHADLPSIASDLDIYVQPSWGCAGQKVTVKGRRYIVRAFEVAEALSKPTQLANI